MAQPDRPIRTRRLATLLVALAISALFAGCGGGGDSDQKAGSPSEQGEKELSGSSGGTIGSGPVRVTFDDTDYGLVADLCQIGGGDGGYAGPDARILVAVGDGGFPKLELNHDPELPDMDKVTLALSSASYVLKDGELDITPTSKGAVGTATLVDTSTSDEMEISFDYECPDEGSTTSDGSTTDDADPKQTEGASKTGFVEWNGTRTSYDAADGDLNPIEGTGLCETHDVTGSEGPDYYRIRVDLEDGTDFFATSSGDFRLGSSLEPIEVSNVSVDKDGRTVAGSADTPQGALEFSFSC